MLALTKKTEYALIALCHLARADDEVHSARDIAARHGIPLPLLMNVLKILNHKGLTQSVRGANGGYRVALPPRQITLARLIEAVEGPLRLVRCISHDGLGGAGECELIATCPVRSPVMKIHRHLERFLDSLTVADIAFDERYGVPVEFETSTERLRVLAP